MKINKNFENENDLMNILHVERVASFWKPFLDIEPLIRKKKKFGLKISIIYKSIKNKQK